MNETTAPAREAGTDPSLTEQGALQALIDGLTWRPCTPRYAAQVGPHEYVVRFKSCPEATWAALQDAIARYGRRQRYLVTGNTFTYLRLGRHRYWSAPGWDVINRALEADVVGKYGPPGSAWSPDAAAQGECSGERDV